MKPFRWIPNSLTVVRMILTVPLVYTLWRGQVALALSILVCAGITDLLDGFLAREFGWTTTLGAWLDPVADKLLITSCLIALTWTGQLPVWFCVITIARDIQLVGGVILLHARGVEVRIRPHLSGKLATVGQNIALLLALLQQTSLRVQAALSYSVLFSAVLTIVSAVVYVRVLLHIFRKQSQVALRRTTSL